MIIRVVVGSGKEGRAMEILVVSFEACVRSRIGVVRGGSGRDRGKREFGGEGEEFPPELRVLGNPRGPYLLVWFAEARRMEH